MLRGMQGNCVTGLGKRTQPRLERKSPFRSIQLNPSGHSIWILSLLKNGQRMLPFRSFDAGVGHGIVDPESVVVDFLVCYLCIEDNVVLR